jgi:molecular chaperone DnaJ
MTTKTKDYYELLGVSKEATADEIRKAYRKLAHLYHPDKTGGDKEAEEKLKEINEAYDVLKNAEKRKAYDQAREGRFEDIDFDGFDFSQASGFGDNFADILSSMFGMGGARAYTAARPGRDLQATVRVTLNDAAKGAKKKLTVARAELCTDCHGSGAAPGSEPETCTECGGAGQLFRSDGMFQASRPCPRCRGLGKRIVKPCQKCEGTGRTGVRREISVTIPAGIEDGVRLRITGEGEAGEPGAPRGDLYVRIEIEPDAFFTRDGNDIVCEVPITFAQAALGDTVTVPTLDGVAKVSVPEGTQNGAKLRLRGMGLPGMGGGKGDQLVKVLVEVPRKLSKEQKQILEQLSGEPAPGSQPLIDRFKNLMSKLRAA